MILSLTSVQLWDKQVHGVLGEELAKGRTQRVVMNGSSSGWQSDTSGFLRGQFQGHFNIFINNLDAGVYHEQADDCCRLLPTKTVYSVFLMYGDNSC